MLKAGAETVSHQHWRRTLLKGMVMVVAGVGFMGAGVIFRGSRGDVLVGLTTAASIWVAAAIGLAAGAGLYLMSAFVALITVLILMTPKVRG